MPEDTGQITTVDVDYYYPENVADYYCEQSTFMQSTAEVVISFFKIEPEAIPGASFPPKVRGRCVARIVVSKEHFLGMLQAMQATASQFAVAQEKPS